MSYDNLKQEITTNITTNGTQAITGQILQNVLVDMVDGIGDDVQQLSEEVDGFQQNYTPNEYLTSTNTTAVHIGWGYTDYIPYTAGNPVLWKFDNANRNYNLLFYDGEKNFISGSNFTGQYNSEIGGREITVSQINYYAPNAAYLRASYTLSYADAEVFIGGVSAWRPQEAQDGLIDNMINLVQTTGLQYCQLQPRKIVGQGYYQQLIIYNADHKVSSTVSNGSFVIPVTAGKHYRIRGSVHAFSVYAVIGFATSTTVGTTGVSLLTVTAETLNYTYSYDYTPTIDGYLFIWSTVQGYGNTDYIEFLDLEYRQQPINDYYLPASLKIQTFGDSITDNYWGDKSSWVNYIPDNIPVSSLTIVNSAVGGSGLGSSASNGVCQVIKNGYQRPDGEPYADALDMTADIVTIFAGTNDYSAGQAISAVEAKLAEALEYIYSNSSAKVIVCTPLQRYNTTDQGFATNADGVPINGLGATLRDYCDAIISVCQRYSAGVLDLNAMAQINRYNIANYSLDGLHPHRGGDIYISDLICKKIKKIVRN